MLITKTPNQPKIKMKKPLDRLNRKMTKQEIEENKILTPPWLDSENPSSKSIKESIEKLQLEISELKNTPRKPLVPGKLLFKAFMIPMIILTAILVLLFLFT